MSYPGPIHFSHIADYVYNSCPLPDPYVGPSDVYMMLIILLSIRPVWQQLCSVLVW